MRSIPATVTAKDLRKAIGAVSIKELEEGSEARRLAGEVNAGGDSYLRGSKEFEAAYKLLERIDGDEDNSKLRLLDEQGNLTEAGKVFKLWRDATSDRADLFDGIGLTGKPSLLRINIENLDLSDLWKTDHAGDPRVCYAGPSTRVSIFETAPHHSHVKVPDEANGVLIWAQGEDAVSVRRRGNMSVNDAKPQLSIYVDKDKESGVPSQLKLINMIRDPSYQRVHVAWDLLEKARVPVQPHTYAELNIDNRHYGTYVAMPPMDRPHFEKIWKPEKGAEEAAVFKANWKDMGAATLRHREGDESGSQYFKDANPEHRTYEPTSDTPDADYKHLARFIKTLNAVDLRDAAGHQITGAQRFNTTEFRTSMEQTMDVYTFLRTTAMFNLMGSWDTYYRTPSNYYLYIEKRQTPGGAIEPYVRFHPYDIDNTFGTSWPGSSRNWHDKSIFYGKAGGHQPDSEVGDIRLVEVLLRNDDFRAYYVDFMSWMVKNHFTQEKVASTQNRLWSDFLQSSVYLESDTEHGAAHTNRPWSNRQVHEAGQLHWELWGFGGQYKVEGIEHFVGMRRKNVLAQLAQQEIGKSRVDFDREDWAPRWS